MDDRDIQRGRESKGERKREREEEDGRGSLRLWYISMGVEEDDGYKMIKESSSSDEQIIQVNTCIHAQVASSKQHSSKSSQSQHCRLSRTLSFALSGDPKTLSTGK